MFGLFDKKEDKIKKEAHKRAINWWKGMTIRGVDEKLRPCQFCKSEIPRMKGYLFSPHHILENEKYMEQEIALLEKRGISAEEAQEIVWKKLESLYEDWMVCENCLNKHFV